MKNISLGFITLVLMVSIFFQEALGNSNDSIPLGFEPGAVAVDSVANLIYVVDQGNDQIRVIDGVTGSMLSYSFNVDPTFNVSAIAVDGERHRLFVNYYCSGCQTFMEVFDTVTQARVSLVNQAYGAGGMAINPDNGRVYVTMYHTVWVLYPDSTGGYYLGKTITGFSGAVSDVTYDRLLNRVYVAIHHTNEVQVVDASNETLISTVSVLAGNPTSVAVNPNNSYVYVGQNLGNKISVVDGDRSPPLHVHDIQVWDGPVLVGVDPTTYRVFVGMREAAGVGIIDGNSDTVLCSLPIFGLPTDLSVNTADHCAYVGVLGQQSLFKACGCDSDGDGDGVVDEDDNCPNDANADQTDNDMDGAGDVCDDDDDNDTVLDEVDNCPLVSNASQADTDGDGTGDACDGDLDGDGVANNFDNCPNEANVDQTDTDEDGAGDECDTNDDNDLWADGADNCPTIVNDGQEDLDGDGVGDACDIDIDGDGIENDIDNCRLIANAPQDDTDYDGEGDACDEDDDNDTVLDEVDNCPLVSNASQADTDGDGTGDACDGDLDGDGVANNFDNCPVIANSGQSDFDLDGVGDACDSDIDGDEVPNEQDECANTLAEELVDERGCSIDQLCPCEGPRGTTQTWRNHGKYVSCVAHATNGFVEDGLISEAEKDAIMSAAGESTCGKK